MKNTRYKRSAGAVFSLKYHLVWCPNYRLPVLTDEVRVRLLELVAEKAHELGAEIHASEVRLPAQRAGLLRAGGPRRKPPAPTPPALHRKKASLLGESPPNPLKPIQLRPIPLRMLMIADVLLHPFCRYLISHWPGKRPVLPEPLWFVSPLFKFWKFAP